jgi:hypothetical protein
MLKDNISECGKKKPVVKPRGQADPADVKPAALQEVPRDRNYLYGCIFWWKSKVGISEWSAYDQRRYMELQSKPRRLDFDKYYQWLVFENGLMPYMAGHVDEIVSYDDRKMIEIMRRAVPEN